MEGLFKQQKYLQGAIEGIERITQILARHFPPRGRHPNELSDKPVVLQ
jgi:uncharacterized membrane protein